MSIAQWNHKYWIQLAGLCAVCGVVSRVTSRRARIETGENDRGEWAATVYMTYGFVIIGFQGISLIVALYNHPFYEILRLICARSGNALRWRRDFDLPWTKQNPEDNAQTHAGEIAFGWGGLFNPTSPSLPVATELRSPTYLCKAVTKSSNISNKILPNCIARKISHNISLYVIRVETIEHVCRWS